MAEDFTLESLATAEPEVAHDVSGALGLLHFQRSDLVYKHPGAIEPVDSGEHRNYSDRELELFGFGLGNGIQEYLKEPQQIPLTPEQKAEKERHFYLDLEISMADDLLKTHGAAVYQPREEDGVLSLDDDRFVAESYDAHNRYPAPDN